MEKRDPIICTYPKLVVLSQLEEIIKRKAKKDKAILISIIEHRLSRRFLKVIDNADKNDLSSFLSIAICCFLIETLECFYEGLPDTNKSGEGIRVFNEFFKREKEIFPDFENVSLDFYLNVRCGLLHQGETMNGWFLDKKGKIFELGNGTKIINGELFYKSTKKAIEKYLSLLTEESFEDDIWLKAFAKLNQVCKNCREIRKYRQK